MVWQLVRSCDGRGLNPFRERRLSHFLGQGLTTFWSGEAVLMKHGLLPTRPAPLPPQSGRVLSAELLLQVLPAA